jgi:hypothetical protein
MATKEVRYIGGPNGLVTHVRSHFTEPEDKGLAKLFDNISRREVSNEDVALMRGGKKSKVEIIKSKGSSSPKKKTATKRKAEAKQSDGTEGLSAPKMMFPFKKSKLAADAAGIISKDANKQLAVLENRTDDAEALPAKQMKPEL